MVSDFEIFGPFWWNGELSTKPDLWVINLTSQVTD